MVISERGREGKRGEERGRKVKRREEKLREGKLIQQTSKI